MAEKAWFENLDSAEKLFNSIWTMIWTEDETSQLSKLLEDIEKSWKFKWKQLEAVMKYIDLVVDFYQNDNK
jgi:hypothetical protein